MTKTQKVELQVPTHLLLSDEAKGQGPVDYKSKTTLTILDGHRINKFDLGKDKVLINGHELTLGQQKEIFKRLGIDQPNRLVLDYGRSYFGWLSRVNQRVAEGDFKEVAEIDEALVPRDEKTMRTLHHFTAYTGIDRPTENMAEIKNAAYAVAQRRHQKVANRESKLRQAHRQVEAMYARGDSDYWVASKKLREAYLKDGNKTDLDRLFAMDKKAYAKAELRIHIPEAEETYLASIGKIKTEAPRVSE